MSDTTKFLTTSDGLKIYVRQWIPPQYKAVICLVHGFGEHIGRYTHVADFFNKNGYAFVGMDNRGHGQSEGKRGHAPKYDAYLDDIQLFLNDIKTQCNGVPLFLYGHSMGGNLVLNYIIKNKPNLAGVVLSSPWIQLAFEPKPIMITMGKVMRSIYPSFTQSSGLVVEHISKDPSVVEAYKNDPLVHSSITASAGLGLNEAAAFLNAYSAEVHLPMLIMHAEEDKLTSQPASEAFSKRTKGDITYKKWSGMYHEIHNEPDKIQVLTYMLGWLDSKV
jgi:alpha-beta hydrolase superfamily lysophospholipase